MKQLLESLKKVKTLKRRQAILRQSRNHSLETNNFKLSLAISAMLQAGRFSTFDKALESAIENI